MPTPHRVLVFLLIVATAAVLAAPPVVASAPGFLTPFDAAPNNNFGISVAISGRTALVGAIGHDSYSGAAYIFSHSGNSWHRGPRLVARDARSGDYFGYSVGISETTAVIGAPYRNLAAGAAYVFERSGKAWIQTAVLTPSDAAPFDYFGLFHSVSISGNTIVVGASGKNSSSGAAYVFTRTGSHWQQSAKLTGQDGRPGDQFGYSTSISGAFIVVGAPGVDGQKGAAYAFAGTGSRWRQLGQLIALDASAGASFGFSTALSGRTVVVGAYGVDASSGAAYVFELSAQSVTVEQAKLVPSRRAPGDMFGWSVAISGWTALIGGHSGLATAAVYTFFRSGGPGWVEGGGLQFAGEADGDYFGESAAMSNVAGLVGAPFKDSGAGFVMAF